MGVLVSGFVVASKRFTIILGDRLPVDVGGLTLPLWRTLAVGLCAFTLPLLMGLGARWAAHSELQQLQDANASLELENDSYRQATAQLSSQIAALQSVVDDIDKRAEVDSAANRAIDKLPATVRARAMGGGTATEAVVPVIGSAFGHADAAFSVLSEILSVIENRLASVRTGVERRHALAAATPSIWPVPGWLSSGFGKRSDPFTGDPNFHPGLDISADRGQPVIATADGTVSHAAFSGAYGNLVVIEHGFDISTKYGHLSRFAVMSGQQISRGDVIGYVGSTGRSTNPHLHYEVWINGRLTNPLRLLGPR
jgi:murein DD-endopeptidase MepM/ murein hydrolase activator NlpD